MSDNLFEKYYDLNPDEESADDTADAVVKAPKEEIFSSTEAANAAEKNTNDAFESVESIEPATADDANDTDDGKAVNADEHIAESAPGYGDTFNAEEPTAADRVFSSPYSADRTDTESAGFRRADATADPHYSYRKVSADAYAEPTYTTPSSYSENPQPQSIRPNPYRPDAGNYSSMNHGYSNHPNHYQAPATKAKKPKAKMSVGAVAIILVVCMVISAGFGFGGAMLASYLNASNAASDGAMVVHRVETSTAAAETTGLVDKSTAEITEEVADSVVEITTEVMQTSSFYGQYIANGAGSGVIISEDGYIITNNHVIDGASSVTVTLTNDETYPAKLVGTDSLVDIALLKIDAKGLTPAVFGDSDSIQVGDKAVIIGNPLGTLGGSVTEGIISALDRSIVIDEKTMNLIQTDASVNPGNSGGGMFNGQGELSGIVVAKSSNASADTTIDNIGFVIPINDVLAILSDLKDYGYVRGRADTGMTFVDLTNSMYSMYYYGNQNTGCYVYSVAQNSNAYQAGFRAGDRIVSVDGTEISTQSDLRNIISKKSAGDTIAVVVERGSQTGTIDLTLEEDTPDDDTYDAGTREDSNADPFGGMFR